MRSICKITTTFGHRVQVVISLLIMCLEVLALSAAMQPPSHASPLCVAGHSKHTRQPIRGWAIQIWAFKQNTSYTQAGRQTGFAFSLHGRMLVQNVIQMCHPVHKLGLMLTMVAAEIAAYVMQLTWPSALIPRSPPAPHP